MTCYLKLQRNFSQKYPFNGPRIDSYPLKRTNGHRPAYNDKD